MNSTRVTFIVVALTMSACASHEGHYAPGCLAFAGDTLELHDGRFHWDRFTDEIRVDDNGNIVDPFPGYPLEGQYRLDGARISFTTDSGSSPEDRYLLRTGGDLRILTSDEYAAWQRRGEYPECSLVRGGNLRKASAAQN